MRFMRSLLYAAATSLCLASLPVDCASAAHRMLAGTVHTTVPTESSTVEKFWTSSKLLNAKPVELSFQQNGFGQLEENAIATGEVASENGSAPTVKDLSILTGLSEKLIHDEDMEAFLATVGWNETNEVPADFSSTANPFTSSRVFPTAAVTTYPYSTIVKVFFSSSTSSFVCSGSLIKNGIVLTAGHCVHSGNGQASGWYRNFYIVPAYNSGSAPYGTWYATALYTTSTWFNGGGTVPNAADFGVIVLKPNSSGYFAGSYAGYLGYLTGSVLKNHVHNFGYPVGFDSGLRMHQVTGQTLTTASSSNTVLMGSDMGGGSSGGPWVQNFLQLASGQTATSSILRVVGVNSYISSTTPYNYIGSSIPDSRFSSLITAACTAYPSRC